MRAWPPRAGASCSAAAAPRAASASRSDAVTLPPAGDRPPVSRRFPRASRLTDKPQFDAAHRQGQRQADPYFSVITRPNDAGRARLGLAVGIKAAGNAVQRNRIKRLVRESFRQRQDEFPALDVVVNARAGAGKCDNAAIRASLAAHWDKVLRRCARC